MQSKRDVPNSRDLGVCIVDGSGGGSARSQLQGCVVLSGSENHWLGVQSMVMRTIGSFVSTSFRGAPSVFRQNGSLCRRRSVSGRTVKLESVKLMKLR